MSSIPADLSAALSDRYELRDLLGRGGMATVYLAYDRKHHRVVALKVLRAELAATIGADRFLKEIQIVAQLTHPHILPLHDSGEAGAFLYYVMPYITGGSLRQRLVEQGPTNVARALEVASPVADALTYAHAQGVLHRDIKPENILFSQGHPIVADFGIAKAVSTASDTQLTRTGLSLGTPGYMSPEQAAGRTDLDVRTDVYSLAVVVYEMLVGEVPGRWPTEDAVRSGRFLEAPASHRIQLTAAGSGIEGALVRGLAIVEEQRTPSPEALIDELKGVPPRRKFRSDEAVEIVKRAALLEATNPTQTGAMTLGGVEALGAEVGIAPELVRSAARGMGTMPPGPAARAPAKAAYSRVAGGPVRTYFERVVDGELPDGEFPYLVDEIRRIMGNAGQVSQLGRSFSWTFRSSGLRRDLEVSVTVRGGRTRIVVLEDYSQLQGAVFGGIGGGMGGGGTGIVGGIVGGALHAPLLLIAVIPAWLLLAYGTARTVYARTSRRRERDLEALADHLAAVIEAEVGSARRLPGPG
ncbi:MAG TPA: serine/threonine-protein kinase [Gemmatimonadales bacterium]|nr:serine/threonine-protein kinase [Gemmatimonadales bacterium]